MNETQNNRRPKWSYGSIVFCDTGESPNRMYLLYQRRDSFEYIDFIRGLWSSEEDVLRMFSNMNSDERQRIREYTFRELWDDLWVVHNSKVYTFGYEKAKHKYTIIRQTIHEYICKTSAIGLESGWGFPKGKKNIRETFISCATREFEEETRLEGSKLQFLDIKPYRETLQTSSGKVYNCLYFVAMYPETKVPEPLYTPQCIRKKCASDEALKIGWYTLEEARHLLHKDRFDMLVLADKAIDDLSTILHSTSET